MSKTTQELIEYFDHINASLNADFDHVFRKTRELIDNSKLSAKDKHDLEWRLTRLHTDMVNFHLTIKQYQEALRDAGKQI